MPLTTLNNRGSPFPGKNLPWNKLTISSNLISKLLMITYFKSWMTFNNKPKNLKPKKIESMLLTKKTTKTPFSCRSWERLLPTCPSSIMSSCACISTTPTKKLSSKICLKKCCSEPSTVELKLPTLRIFESWSPVTPTPTFRMATKRSNKTSTKPSWKF